MEPIEKPPVMDMALNSDLDEEEKQGEGLKRANSFTDNLTRVTMLTRKASKLLDQQERTDVEITELLQQQGFSQQDIDRAKAAGAKDIHQAIDLLTEVGRPEVMTPKGGYECLICQGDVGNSREIVLGCDHVFCMDCFKEYLALKVSEAQVLSIRCPNHQCTTVLPEETILKYLTPHETEKYRRFLLKGQLSKNPHLRWCPRLNCEGYCVGDSSKKHLTCGVCLYEYCYYCSEPWHGDSACKEQGDQLLDAWARENNVRYCPNCRLRVEKMMGCSHMICTQCQYQWCWLCGEQWTDSHFATCSEFRRWWQDPPIFVILLCLAAPFSMVFLNILVCCLLAASQNEVQDPIASITPNKWISYSLIVVLSLIFSPICFVLFVVGLPIYLAVITCLDQTCNNCSNTLVVLLVGLYFALTVIGLVITAVALIVWGLAMVGTKTYIAVRRCFVSQAEIRPKYNAMW
jgi:hypothetical protein